MDAAARLLSLSRARAVAAPDTSGPRPPPRAAWVFQTRSHAATAIATAARAAARQAVAAIINKYAATVRFVVTMNTIGNALIVDADAEMAAIAPKARRRRRRPPRVARVVVLLFSSSSHTGDLRARALLGSVESLREPGRGIHPVCSERVRPVRRN